MVRLGWISPAVEPRPRVRALLRFFGVASPEAWEVVYGGFHFTYRKSPAFTSDPAHLAAWLRQGELAATQMDCLAYDQIQFKGALCALRGWTTTPFVHAEANLVKLCQLAGVAVATVPELPKTRVSGATRWVTSSKALIQLSLRNRTSDCLWFAFFHEAAHILLHGKKEVFVEFDGHEDPKEKEADRWAENFLIPRSDWRHFVNAGDPKRIDIQSFAEELRIDPGIVAGRLQREKRIPFTTRNDLKRRSRCLAAEAEVVSTR
jgi:hypothetical protein